MNQERWLMKAGAAIVGLCLLSVCLSAAAGDDVPLTSASVVEFATPTQGAALLARPDRFLNALSRFDCQARLQTDKEVTSDDIGSFSAAQVMEWSAAEQSALRTALGAVRERMQPFQLPLPSKIILVKTTGKEEGNAAYCRGNVIVLPSRMTQQRPAALQRLLIHELFHVLSSHNPDLRRQLYAIIGFTTCEPVQLPPTLRDRKLTNPDAPLLDASITLMEDGGAVEAVPVLLASSEAYDVKRGGTFFDYLMFRLLVVEAKGAMRQPVLRDGQPWLLDPKSTSSYQAQIGKNTTYIIHPDEILADNFVHLINQTPRLESPEIVDAMRKQLTR